MITLAVLVSVGVGATVAQKASVSPQTPRYIAARYDKSGDFPSPDRRFIARLTHAEGDTKTLTIHTVTRGKPLLKSLIIAETDIHNVQWVPRQLHSLLIGVNGIYNPNPRLVLWRGGNTLRTLTADKTALLFVIKDISSNGRIVRYERRGESDLQDTQRTPLRSLSLTPFLSKAP
ncbi:MAG: hypothetical protein H7Y38_17700 [Armatimonadetes bacterium]|nr:hypothetical protein [Armatimonadota bacterium]